MQRDIRHRWFYQHPPQRVWEFLTDPVLLKEWLTENNFKAEIGHAFQFKTKAKPGFDGNIYCEVLELIPRKRLSYSWKGGPGNGKVTLDSVVTWTLTEKDGGTELLLEHTGFNGIGNFITYLIMNKGWSVILKKRLSKILTDHHEVASR